MRMIEKLGTKLGEYFFSKSYIKEEDIDAVRYYIEVFYNEYLQLIITLLIGYLINQLETTIIYLFCFVAIRKYSGGYIDEPPTVKMGEATFYLY